MLTNIGNLYQVHGFVGIVRLYGGGWAQGIKRAIIEVVMYVTSKVFVVDGAALLHTAGGELKVKTDLERRVLHEYATEPPPPTPATLCPQRCDDDMVRVS